MLKFIFEPDSSGSVAQRPAAAGVVKGYVYYNSDIDVYNVSDLTNWIDVTQLSAQELLTRLGLVTTRVFHTTGVMFTPNIDSTDIHSHIDSEIAGTLTVNNPIGTAIDVQSLLVRLKCNNVQTMAWGNGYRGLSVTPLPTESLAGKTQYLLFKYHKTDQLWDLLAINQEV